MSDESEGSFRAEPVPVPPVTQYPHAVKMQNNTCNDPCAADDLQINTVMTQNRMSRPEVQQNEKPEQQNTQDQTPRPDSEIFSVFFHQPRNLRRYPDNDKLLLFDSQSNIFFYALRIDQKIPGSDRKVRM